MILLRLISWPYVRKRGLRAVLTLLGIALGVAVFVSMHLANQRVFGAFEDTVNRIAGATQLQITAGEPGMEEEVLERVQGLREVKVAVPVIESVVGTTLPGQGNMLVLGVDMTGDRSLRDYDLQGGDDAVVDDPLVFLAQPDSLMVTTQFAERNHIATDQKIPLQTADGIKQFTVRGILKSGGLNSAFGGNLAIMDIYAAQHVFGRGRKFDRIDLAVNPGVRIADAQERIRESLGPGFQVEPPASRAQNLESMSRVYSFMLKFSSAFALVIGIFIIYNAFAIAVTQRRSEIGILRALGATRRQIAFLFLSEGAVAGLIGSIIGVMLGSVLAGTITRSVSRLLEGVYGVAHVSTKAVLSPDLMLTAVALGVATSVLAALLPARSAARVDPVKALQKGRVQVLSAGESRVRLVAAVVLAGCSFALLAFSHSLRMFYVAYACIVSGALLLVPQLSLWLARVVRPLLKWVHPVEGALAADSLIGAPRRTSATVAALMFSLAMVIGLAGSARSAYVNIAQWIDVYLDSDLFVTSSPTLVVRDYRFPASMGAELESIRGIEEVQAVRSFRVRYGNGLMLVIGRELNKAKRRGRVFLVEGDPAKVISDAAAGKGVIVSETLSSLKKLQVGDEMQIPTPKGILKLPVLGVAREYSDQQGSVILDRAVMEQWWNEDAVDVFRVYLARDANAAQVKESILARFTGNRRIFVLSNDQVRDYVLRVTNQWFSMTWIQVVVAILVAVLGIVNSLTVSITDRRRELGVLQAVGALRNQVRGTIWMEAVGIGMISVALGLALGAIQLYYVLQIGYRDYPGMHLSYLYPVGIALLLIPVMLAVCLVSALAPAESAVHGSLVEALEYE